jgi:tripartite-type tricarboxylate transporter receptor subunit TctC
MRRFSTAIIVLLALVAPMVQAQTYPAKSVRIIVPYVPGGTVDLVGRVLAQLLSQQMGQQVIVENKAGASGMIGSDAVAKAQPDGYTLLVQSATLVAGPLMVKSVPYDVLRDFTPISQLGSVPMVMTANPAVPGSNLREFIAAARARPNAFNFGIPAAGSPMHLAGEAIKHSASLDITVVTYKGTGAAITDLLGGQIQVMIDAIPSSAGHIASGKMKPLAVTTATRVPSLPNVPTVAESGLPGFEMVSWYGLWGPARLPPEVTSRLATEAAKAMHSPVVSERLGSQSFVPAGTPPNDFTAFITKEIATYTRVVREANIRVD